MVKDKRSDVVIVSASQTDDTRTIEGYRPLDNCNDENEDIYLQGKGKESQLVPLTAFHDQFSELD